MDWNGKWWIKSLAGQNEFQHFTTENGLISNAIMGIAEDSSGYLWLSTFNGIIRFDPETKNF